jgi:2-polyprenyl-3-methyl-5-hydroxy-6-metoxy-1,4-benzoquinol methylase
MPTLREAWTYVISAADYEAHMASIGQAQANASLVEEFLQAAPPPPGSAILIAGAGTGQMFDYIPASILTPYCTTFTDINAGYLQILSARLQDITFELAVDDIESSALAGPFDLAIAVLVLEHVDWPRAVASLCRLSSRVFVVSQENSPQTQLRPLAGSLVVLRDVSPHLIPRKDLEAEFAGHALRAVRESVKEAADAKRMIGIEFSRNG